MLLAMSAVPKQRTGQRQARYVSESNNGCNTKPPEASLAIPAVSHMQQQLSQPFSLQADSCPPPPPHPHVLNPVL
jgi:hypothetical protein